MLVLCRASVVGKLLGPGAMPSATRLMAPATASRSPLLLVICGLVPPRAIRLVILSENRERERKGGEKKGGWVVGAWWWLGREGGGAEAQALLKLNVQNASRDALSTSRVVWPSCRGYD
ncbi:hypothetical protein K402DRAFT_61775 [Aulographum hederae CBS 113979]|uniref:Uncharacterized protein n=1 Tax=Aulographum hederae CBS 113979 TaxID=1176131 RepID=A0A6G1H1U5_9PEZI|nr:hypothetical protein K402DRAFT_61775 [Aulographum hederae CBS 113979]